MPIYEYQCTECGHRFETLQRMSDDPLTECESCGGEVKKLISAPAFQFKGSGWYVTDYARKDGAAGGSESKDKGKEGGESSGSSAKSEGGSDSASSGDGSSKESSKGASTDSSSKSSSSKDSGSSSKASD